MDKKLLFVFNPYSGKAQIKNHLFDILDLFAKNCWDVSVRPTQAPMDAYNYVLKKAGNFKLIVVSGGDGTLSETVNALMEIDEKKRPDIGYIPAGTTNDFASNLKISHNMTEAAENIMSNRTFDIDVGKFNDKNFVYVAAFGAFTDVSYDTPQQTKNMLGHMAYLFEGIKRVSTLKPYHLKVEYGEDCLEDDYIFGMVSNTNYVGGFKNEGFGAELNDGLFEVVLVKNPKDVIETQSILAYILKQNFNNEFITTIKTPNVKFNSEDEISWTLDGEFGGSFKKVNVDIIKQALTLHVKAEDKK